MYLKDFLTTRKRKKPPYCWSCKHFGITWDPRFPYTCKLMGFKSKITPCLEVVRIDGINCLGYEEKLTKGNVKTRLKMKRRRKLNLTC